MNKEKDETKEVSGCSEISSKFCLDLMENNLSQGNDVGIPSLGIVLKGKK